MTIGLIAKLGPRLAVVGVVLIVLIGTSPRLKQLILDPNTGLFFAGWSFWWNSTLQSFADPIMWSYVKRLVSSKKSADPGRRKGERVREEEVLHCYYYRLVSRSQQPASQQLVSSSQEPAAS